MKIKFQIKSIFSYSGWSVRTPEQTQRLQAAEEPRHLLWHGWNYGEWQQGPERRKGAWSHASKCCRTNPISSLTGVLLMTFTILTAADQNITYLFMHASRNHMLATEVYVPGKKTINKKTKKQTDISQSLWHWASGQSAIIWELHTVTQ